MTVFDLDNWRCRVFGCGKKTNLQDHHVIPRSQGGSDELKNRMTVCDQCHQLINENKLTDFEILTKLKNAKIPDFRWDDAYEWHVNRNELQKIKNNRQTY